jgi:heat shock protein HslJ
VSERTDSTSEQPADSEPSDAEFVIGTWRTVRLGGEDIPDDVVSTITFTEAGRAQGNSGVNTFGGSFQIIDTELEFGPMFTTRMAGPEPAMAHENRLLRALDGRRPYTFEADELVIGGGADEVRLHRTEDGGDVTTDDVDDDPSR